jgi:hypothetical protein
MKSPILHHEHGPVCPLCAAKLKEAHPNLASWFMRCVKPRYPYAHISWSFRDKANQDAVCADGKSKLKWPNSPHNKTDPKTGVPKAEALDLFLLGEDGVASWPYKFFSQVAEQAKNESECVFWGGHFKTIWDADHFQIQEEGKRL